SLLIDGFQIVVFFFLSKRDKGYLNFIFFHTFLSGIRVGDHMFLLGIRHFECLTLAKIKIRNIIFQNNENLEFGYGPKTIVVDLSFIVVARSVKAMID
ncbi:hypothetical protein ACJX0J_013062, partial [Zea mays]